MDTIPIIITTNDDKIPIETTKKSKRVVVTAAPPQFRIPTRAETLAANRRPTTITKAENPEHFKQDDEKLKIPDYHDDEESNVDFSSSSEEEMDPSDPDWESTKDMA